MAHREVQALGEELGLMGHVSITPLDKDRNAMVVTTHESLDDIIAICSFVINADEMQVSELPALSDDQAKLENAARAKVEDELGYGFFDTTELKPAAAAGEGYGFFQPLDEIRANAAAASEDAQGYGFFQPVEQIRAAAGIVIETPPEEEKKVVKKEEKEKEKARRRAPNRPRSASRLKRSTS
jgi:two-component system chemotaxis sensor kinase CheA